MSDDRFLVIDIENDADRLLCIGWQWSDEEVTHCSQAVGPALRTLLRDPEVAKASWSSYDTRWLISHGVNVQGPLYDGMVMAWLSNENTPLNLEWCALRYIHVKMDKRIRSSSGKPVFRTDEGREVPLGEAPIGEVMKYNREDVSTTTLLINRLRSRMHDNAWWDFFEDEHQPFTDCLVRMMLRGLPVDLAASEELRAELDEESVRLGAELHAVLNLPESFNLNSGPQLSGLLFSKVFDLTDTLTFDPEWASEACLAIKSCINGEHEDCDIDGTGLDEVTFRGQVHAVDWLPPHFTVESVGRLQVHGRWTLKGLGLPPGIPTPSGDRPSSSSPALLTNFEAAKTQWVQDFLRYRKMTKVLTTYLNKWPDQAVEGRIYGRFNQTGTVTGRLSSSQPNLQNIPAHGELGPKVRRLFRAPEGRSLLVGDYSQLEPRLMAHFSRDPLLLDVYTTGKDIYREVAAAIFGCTPEAVTPEQRGIGKTYVLAMGYGAGAKKLQQILIINGYPMPIYEVSRHLDSLQTKVVPVFFRWRESVITKAKRDGHVTTLSGQMRRLSAQFKSSTWKARGYGERQAVNAVIQGSAGDIVRKAMMNCDRQFPHLALLAQVHDELVWEYAGIGLNDEDLASVAMVAETWHGYDLAVPLVFEPHVGPTWFDAKEGTTFVLPEDFASQFEDEDAEVEEV